MVNILGIVTIVGLVSICTPSSADIYKYEDESGVLHFTNHPQIPNSSSTSNA